MRPLQPFWCIATLQNLPEGLSDEGIVLAAGLPEEWEPDESDLHFMLLCRTLAASEAQAHGFVRNCLRGLNVKSAVRVETLATGAATVSRAERELVQKLEEAEVSVRSTFIGFKPDSEEAAESGRQVLQQVIGGEA